MRMADQLRGDVVKDSLQELQLRSLYTMAGTQFVIPEFLKKGKYVSCLLYTSPSPRDRTRSRMPSSA